MINKIEMIIVDSQGKSEKTIDLIGFIYKTKMLDDSVFDNYDKPNLAKKLSHYYDFKDALETNGYDSFKFIKNNRTFSIKIETSNKSLTLSPLILESIPIQDASFFCCMLKK